MRLKKPFYAAVSLLTVLLLVLAGIIGGLQGWEPANPYSTQTQEPSSSKKTITRDGVAYFPRQDITTFMILGIDAPGPVESSGSYRNNGEADFVMLLILDQKEESYTVLHLNRDTMLDMSTLGVRGEYVGTNYGQLALAHTYGNGLEDSCENVKDTLQKFLPGLTIDYYLAMRMDAIPILNDAVGGVTVNVVDDFSLINPSITMGELTLRGEQAITFVRTRKNVGDQLNLSRIERQKEYVNRFAEAFRAKQEQSSEFILSAYEKVAPYLVSDCSVNTISGMLNRYEGYEVKEIITPEGENVLGEEYYEFYVDEEKLDSLVLRLFYAEK